MSEYMVSFIGPGPLTPGSWVLVSQLPRIGDWVCHTENTAIRYYITEERQGEWIAEYRSPTIRLATENGERIE